MGLFSAILGGVGIVSSIFGAKKQASAQKQATQGNADIAGLNKDIALENARDVTLAGRDLEIEQYKLINRSIGTARAAAAGAGIEVDLAGTVSQDLVDDMRHVGAIDIQRIRQNVALERKKFEGQAEDFALRQKFGTASAQAISPGFAGLTAGLNAGISAYSAGFFDEVF